MRSSGGRGALWAETLHDLPLEAELGERLDLARLERARR